MWKQSMTTLKKIYSLVGSTVNTVVYSVNVRVKFYSYRAPPFTMLLIQQICNLKCFFSLRFNEWKISNLCFKLHSLGGTTINIVTYSVNVRVKFYSIEGATIYDAAYSANLDLEMLFFITF